ncbi:nitrate reductase [Pseudonocardiaceae bacterium YIM PH 21723]|nr:nitrate reductase [Pseudonocardiaceae bacterium YIM PH 21723]
MALWTLHGDGRRVADGDVVEPQERLSWPLTIGFGIQHLLVMFSATVLVPVTLTKTTGGDFSVTTTLLFSGIGTLLFLLLTKGKVPAIIGSSFAFLVPAQNALIPSGDGTLATPAQIFGAIIVVGLLVATIGLAVKSLGANLIEVMFPPLVTGTVVMIIGLQLAKPAINNFHPAHSASLQLNSVAVGSVTLAIILVLSAAKGVFSRFAVLIGVAVGWVVAAFTNNLDPNAVRKLHEDPWFGLPKLTGHVEFAPTSMVVLLPVVIVLIAENVGHVKAIATITGRNLDKRVGNSLIGEGLATALAGWGGGSGTTTYAENIGVMAVTKIYSTAAYVVAACTAILVSFSPKFGALIYTVPDGALGGAAIVLFGMIAMIGIRIWADGKVRLSDPVNLVCAGAALIIALGDFEITYDTVTIGSVLWATVGIVVLYPILRRLHGRTHHPDTDEPAAEQPNAT